ncbi:histidine phosphatase family protein [Paenibacillus mesophilus]|uniref:histidine phosphatase family protein n=1 Tax=Paenibacillus mesophilus TaxID=2582849 RepID=UPI00110D3BBB|nr:histidine phosphatase family protein [Paenibacillus mesophilus]TMV50315.1 histidine phosphatase family protein [Paenibacillus mesophilus]
MKTYIYFVRHAKSLFVPSVDQERARGLTEQGKRDAAKVTDLLAEEGIDVLVSSPYARAVETIQGLADHLNKKIAVYEELRERPIASLAYDIPEEMVQQAIEKSFTDADYCLTEGESTRMARERAMPIIQSLLSEHKGRNVVIGTHGNIMTIIMNGLDRDYGYGFWKQTTKPDVYKLEFEEERLRKVERLWKPQES